jgi:hypothetical protein
VKGGLIRVKSEEGRENERKKKLEGATLPDISCISMVIGCRPLDSDAKSSFLHFISCKKIDFRP